MRPFLRSIGPLFLALTLVSLPVFAAPSPPELFHILDAAPLKSAGVAAAVAERAIDVRFEALEAPEVVIPLLDGQQADVKRLDVELRREGDFAWRGSALGAAGEHAGNVTLTVKDGRMMGRIVVGGASYQIVPAEDGHRLVEIDESLLDPCESTGGAGHLAPHKSFAAPPLALESVESVESVESEEPISRLPIIVLYDAAARDGAGGQAAIEQFIQHEVDLANSAYANSHVDVRLELAHVEEAPRTFASTGQALDWVRLDRYVRDLRRAHQAPLASLVIETFPNACGVAAQILRQDTFLDRNAPAEGASLLRRSCLGSNLLLAHEVGHNLGCEHDPAWGSPLQSSLFPYAYGHFVDGSFRTVMSYPNECTRGCPRAEHFSNPDVSYNGHPTGIPGERDNHQVINRTRARFTAPGNDTCRPGLNTLCLGRNRYKVQVDWYNLVDDSNNVGRAVRGTETSGFFTFNDPSNIQLMVKVLDSGASAKVYYSQLTDMYFELILTDTRTGAYEVYGNTQGNCGGVDINAFANADELSADSKRASCRPSRNKLCLQDGRFQVEVQWRNPGNGRRSQASAVSLSKAAGAFYFGNRTNYEVMAKILNQNGRIDVSYGSLSDLEYTIKVTDTRTGKAKTYTNPAGRYCGGREIQAF